QMAQLIEGLLSLARLERQSLSIQPFSLRKLIREVFEEKRQEWEGAQIELRLGDLPDCSADPVLLRQALVNLLSNAIKFTRGKQEAVIEAGSNLEGNERVYFIRDNGIGFDMRHAQKLFVAFHRLHSNEQFKGTGIGLSIVQQVINRHGGRIWAQAEPNNGATFYFTLPQQ
ncbi:MAG TPA: ATP-binding protein, partial [Verrucomicrobiae bacterium]